MGFIEGQIEDKSLISLSYVKEAMLVPGVDG
jgi:hypothetical protein